MAIHNTSSDAANTAVRAYLTSLGEKFLGHGFNTGSGKGREIWEEIKSSFNQCCAYCNTSEEKLTVEHLISFNREAGGLHHPGNIVPCCRHCNRRDKIDGKEVDWETHLLTIAKKKGLTEEEVTDKKNQILIHIQNYNYPGLEMTLKQKDKIKSVAEWLYNEVQDAVKRSKDMYLAK